MTQRILFIDDDEKILRGYKRRLRGRFETATATGGDAGLALIRDSGPFAVVVVDMRMPGMDGLQVLKSIQDISPDTVRMMLTGNADMQTAVDAINQGHIFRFLTKPCEPDDLATSLEAALRQYRLVMAERELLGDTLAGSVKVLTDILALINPQAFGRASRVRRVVKHIARQLGLNDVWEFEMAGALCQIGCVSLPPQVLRRAMNHEMLSRDEQALMAGHPEAGFRLLRNIPRMEAVAEMVAKQQDPFWMVQALDKEGRHRSSIGAQMLKVALDLDEYLQHGLTFEATWRKMTSKRNAYNPDILDALMDLHINEKPEQCLAVTVADLQVGMIAGENINSASGVVLVSAHEEITYPVLERLRRAAEGGAVVEPFLARLGGWIECGFGMVSARTCPGKPVEGEDDTDELLLSQETEISDQTTTPA